MNRMWVVMAAAWAGLAAGALGADRRNYAGKIGDGLGVHIELSFEEDENHEVNGSYYYDKTGLPLMLKGSGEEYKTIELSEYPFGKRGKEEAITGHLTFTIMGRALKGTWTSADVKKKLPLEAKLALDYETLSLKRSDQVDVSWTYPIWTDEGEFYKNLNALEAKINKSGFEKDAKEMIDENEESIKEDLGVLTMRDSMMEEEVVYQSADLVSLICTHYQYTGGAHGMTVSRSRTYENVKGKPKELTLDSLFTGDYVPKISAALIADLKEQEASLVVEGTVRGFEKKELSCWTISPSGIEFTFDQYEVGCYAEGAYSSLVRWNAIKNFVKPNGPAGKWVGK